MPRPGLCRRVGPCRRTGRRTGLASARRRSGSPKEVTAEQESGNVMIVLRKKTNLRTFWS